MSDAVPSRLPDETGMTKEPICVEPAPDQKFSLTSRINFAKLYTVEHNVNVKNIGEVAEKSMVHFRRYWKEALET